MPSALLPCSASALVFRPLREAFGRLTQFSAAGLGFLGFLATDATGEFAFLLRIDRLDETFLRRIGLQGQGLLLARGLGQGFGGFLGGFQLGDGLRYIYLSTLAVGPCRR